MLESGSVTQATSTPDRSSTTLIPHGGKGVSHDGHEPAILENLVDESGKGVFGRVGAAGVAEGCSRGRVRLGVTWKF